MIEKTKWTKKELETLEKCELEEKVPLLDIIYVVLDRRKHESGYKILKTYGIAFNEKYAKQLTTHTDIIDFQITENSRINVDCPENGVMRYFLSEKDCYFKVGNLFYSSLKVKIIKKGDK